jgi:hypothetical protein
MEGYTANSKTSYIIRGIALSGVFCVFHLGFDKTDFELDLICLY